MSTVLIVDDERSMRVTLAMFLKRQGFQVSEANGVREALEKIEQELYDVVLTDLKMADGGGIEVLQGVKRVNPEMDVIIFTAYGSIGSAVEAMKLGASDYLTKPFEPDQLLLTIQKALERKRLLNEVRYLRAQMQKRHGADTMIVQSAKMQALLGMAAQVARTDATILIQGESGTGKELLAGAIHAWSPRAERPLITIDCGAIPESLLESELFGHVKGAFTGALVLKKGLFEEGEGGTVFLDEVGAMPAATQVRLLRVLQERVVRRVGDTRAIPIDIRVVGATNQDLKTLVERGALREDLYYRLNGIVLKIPPLRERREDILALTGHFLQRFGQRFGRPVKGISAEAMAILLQHAWPGNVRELEKALEHAVILGRSESIMPEDLPPTLRGQDAPVPASLPLTRGMTLTEMEKAHLLAVLSQHAWNQTKAAEELGINRTTLWRKLKEYHLETPPEWRHA